MVLRYAIFLSNLILHSDSVCDILRSIVDYFRITEGMGKYPLYKSGGL